MNEQKYGKLKLTLKSDLCAGSGYSYAGIVDSDTAYDDCGLPFIPARRLKGCMREAAETILYGLYTDGQIESVFGKSGSESGSELLIDNAYIKDYDGLKGLLSKRDIIKTQEILDRFTHIIGQTKLEDGVAEEGSLRYTRVVNHFSPIDQKEMVFFADFSCRTDDWDMVVKAAKATRHIGLKRNRGLGNVRIEVMETESREDGNRALIVREDTEDGRTVLRYAVENVQPLMQSGRMEDVSADFIYGQQVLGLLAGRYLKEAGHAANTPEFQALFLDGSTIFSNLYPYDGKYTYYPAPDYLNRLKKTKKLVYNIAAELPREEDLANPDEYWYEGGNQPKKLKGKYIAWTDRGIAVSEIKKDVLYHHSHRNVHETENSKEEGILYSMEAIRRGQKFAGFISVPTEYAETILRLLCKGDLYFGKSKTAQYGRCILTQYKVSDSVVKKTFDAGCDIVVTFLSDAILYDTKGNPTVFYNEVRDAIKTELGISTDESEESYMSSIQSTTVTGYLSVWNLRKPAVPAVKSGSYVTYHLTEPFAVGKLHVGERNLEGYGMIRIDNADSCKFDGLQEAPADYTAEKTENNEERIKGTVDALCIPIIYDRWLDRKIYAAINGNEKVSVSNTAAGRFALMLRESIAESTDRRDAFTRFGERIESFKTGSTRDEGRKILKRIGDDKGSNAAWQLKDDALFFESDEELQRDLEAIGKEDSQDEKVERWTAYVMAILTDRKYEGRKEQ